jgi:hypothetical protein
MGDAAVSDLRELETPTAEEIAFARRALDRYRRRLRRHAAAVPQAVWNALDGPPPTPEELAEARRQIVEQQARDEGKGGLF